MVEVARETTDAREDARNVIRNFAVGQDVEELQTLVRKEEETQRTGAAQPVDSVGFAMLDWSDFGTYVLDGELKAVCGVAGGASGVDFWVERVVLDTKFS